MGSTGNIEHSGIISRIDGNRINVRITSQSACSECHAKSSCSASEVQEKYIEIFNDSRAYEVGEPVSVVMRKNLGYRAVFLGYLLPFIVIMLVMIVLQQLTGNELLSGLAAIGALIPYYLLLSVFNKSLRRTFSFQIEKRNTLND